MEDKNIHIRKDERSCYRTPEGYFENLTARIVERAQTQPATEVTPNKSWGDSLRQLGGFAAGFALLVGIAAAAFYLTPKSALEQHQQVAVNTSIEEFTQMYDVTEDDILDYFFQDDHTQKQENAQLAMAIDEYLTTYPATHITEEELDEIDFKIIKEQK